MIAELYSVNARLLCVKFLYVCICVIVITSVPDVFVTDNCNIRELDPKWYRHHIGFVSQEPVLFACSIAENISYGRSDATKEQVPW